MIRPLVVALPCEPGRGFCQDLALELELAHLTAQLAQLLALGAADSVCALAFVAIGLCQPVADGLCTRLELLGQFIRTSPCTHQSYQLTAKLRRIRRSRLRHGGHLLL